MQGEPKPKQLKVKSEKGEHKSGFGVENKGAPGKPSGAEREAGRKYTEVGATAGMHGKAKGGHPTIRAQEMKGC